LEHHRRAAPRAGGPSRGRRGGGGLLVPRPGGADRRTPGAASGRAPRRPPAVIAPTRGPGIRARSLNRVVLLAVGRLGLPLPGTWVLHTVGRRSGRRTATPVCLAEVVDGRYLVAPRGETGWARNLRARPECELRRGGRRIRLRATEVTGEERAVAVV